MEGFIGPLLIEAERRLHEADSRRKLFYRGEVFIKESGENDR